MVGVAHGVAGDEFHEDEVDGARFEGAELGRRGGDGQLEGKGAVVLGDDGAA